MFGSLRSDDSSLCHVVHISEVFKNARSGFSTVEPLLNTELHPQKSPRDCK